MVTGKRYKFAGIPYAILSSKVFLIWLSGGWILYYVLSAIWIEQAFGGFVNGLRENIFIQIPFILFLVSGYLNLLRSSKSVFKKGRIQFLIWLLLPFGVLLFFTGFFLSISTRQAGQRIFGMGDVIKPPWVSKGYRIVSIQPGLRPDILDIEQKAGIFAHEPKLTVLDQADRSYTVGAFPPERIQNTYYHILNFGIAPGIRFMEGDRTRQEGYMPLRILLFGSSDFFEIQPYPYRFLVSMEPEKSFQKGENIASQYNLKKPVYRVKVFKGDELIQEGDSRQGIRFDTFTLHFFEPTYWVVIESVKDPAVPILRFGILLIITGIPASLIRFALIRK
jgi:hypothetical protein